MICGGGRIEFLNPSESGFTSNVFPACLPPFDNGILFENRIITFGRSVQETSLERPWKSTMLIQGNPKGYGYHGTCALERSGNNIFAIGCSPTQNKGKLIQRYDVTSNELITLTTLPYDAYNMTTVTYKDNIIILGGQNYEDYIVMSLGHHSVTRYVNVQHPQPRMQPFAIHAPGNESLCSCDHG